MSDPSSFFEWIAEHFWLAIGILSGWIFNRQDERIKTLEQDMKTKVSLDDNKAHIQKIDQKVESMQSEMREGFGSLRDKIEGQYKELMKAFYEGERRTPQRTGWRE